MPPPKSTKSLFPSSLLLTGKPNNNAISQSTGAPTPVTSSSRDNIKVFVRVRPLREHEDRNGAEESVAVLGRNTLILKRGHSSRHQMKFDHVFPKESNQEEIYGAIRESLVIPCLSGFNATIFAYGQTGAGKTYTILGDEKSISNISLQAKQSSLDSESASLLMNRGLIPRVVEHILRHMAQTSKQIKYKLYCSYLEIYSEKIYDLLLRNNDHEVSLDIRQDRNSGVYVKDLTTIQVSRASDIYELLELGAKNRSIRSTESNERSSRSHTIFQLLIEQEPRHVEGVRKISKLNIVDLAGSERWVSMSKGCDAERIAEMTSINSSLATLGNCINALSQKGRNHVPFRDSKLTRLLQDSLGGNSKTVFISNISPSILHHDETFSTLRFAERANRVSMNATINEVVDDSVLIQRYEKEIDRLRSLLKKKSERANEDILDENRRLREDNEKLVAYLKSTGNLEQARVHERKPPSVDPKFAEKIKLLEQIEKDQQKREEELSKYHNWLHSIPVIAGEDAHSLELKSKMDLMQKTIQHKTEDLERTKGLFLRDLSIMQSEIKDKTEELSIASQQIEELQSHAQDLEQQLHIAKGNKASEAPGDSSELLKLLSTYESMKETLIAQQKMGLETFTKRLSLVIQEHISDEILPRVTTGNVLDEEEIQEELSRILEGCCDALVAGILSKQGDFVTHVHQLLRKLHDVSMTMSIHARKERFSLLKKLRGAHQKSSSLSLQLQAEKKLKAEKADSSEKEVQATNTTATSNDSSDIENTIRQILSEEQRKMAVSQSEKQQEHSREWSRIIKELHKLKDFQSSMFVKVVSLKNSLSRILHYITNFSAYIDESDETWKFQKKRLQELLTHFEMDCEYFEKHVLHGESPVELPDYVDSKLLEEGMEESPLPLGHINDDIHSNTESNKESDERAGTEAQKQLEAESKAGSPSIDVLSDAASPEESPTTPSTPSRKKPELFIQEGDSAVLRSPLSNIMNYQSPQTSESSKKKQSSGRSKIQQMSPPALPENQSKSTQENTPPSSSNNSLLLSETQSLRKRLAEISRDMSELDFSLKKMHSGYQVKSTSEEMSAAVACLLDAKEKQAFSNPSTEVENNFSADKENTPIRHSAQASSPRHASHRLSIDMSEFFEDPNSSFSLR